MSEQPLDERRTDKSAVWSAGLGVFGGVALLLGIGQLIPQITGYGAGVLSAGFAIIVAALAVLFGLVGVSRILQSKGHLKGLALAIVGILFAIGTVGLSIAQIKGSNAMLAAIGCSHNLTAIQGGKEQYEMEVHWLRTHGENDPLPTDEVLRYVGDRFSICPSRGQYTCNGIEELPSCSVHGTLADIERNFESRR